jgi:hypothetical protein
MVTECRDRTVNPKERSDVPVETLTCIYDSREDRLLLALNYKNPYTRRDFWITRRFLLKLLPFFFERTTHVPNQKNNEAKSSATSTDVDLFSLTQTTPVLLESVDIQSGGGTIRLTFKNITLDIAYSSVLDERAFESFVRLLIQAAPSYEWGIQNW